MRWIKLWRFYIVIDKAVDNNRRGFNYSGDAGRQEDSGWGKQLHEVSCSKQTLPNVKGSSGNLEVDKNFEDVTNKALDNRRGL